MTKEQAKEKLKIMTTTKFNNDYSIDNIDKESIETVLSIIEEQDKIIDLMSEYLTTPIHGKEWVKRFFEEKVKEGEIK